MFLYYAYSRQKYFEKYNAENCNFPFYQMRENIVSCKKELIHPKNICESKIKKKEITKFGNNISMNKSACTI